MEYTFYTDKLYKIWQRSTHKIEADSKNSAMQQMINLVENGEDYDEEKGFIENEMIDDSERLMHPSEVDGEPTITIELNDSNDDSFEFTGKPFYTNKS